MKVSERVLLGKTYVRTADPEEVTKKAGPLSWSGLKIKFALSGFTHRRHRHHQR